MSLTRRGTFISLYAAVINLYYEAGMCFPSLWLFRPVSLCPLLKRGTFVSICGCDYLYREQITLFYCILGTEVVMAYSLI